MNRACLLAGFAALLVALGCGPPALVKYDEKTLETADQFGKIAAAYKQAHQKLRRAPSAEELKPFLKKLGDPDALLTSPQDGKPIVIVPGPAPDTPPAEGEQPIIAYEQTGVNGKRMTVDSRGTIVFVTDKEFSTMKFAGGHKPAGR